MVYLDVGRRMSPEGEAFQVYLTCGVEGNYVWSLVCCYDIPFPGLMP